ncbi:BUD13-like protein [Quillaja saponaria]|uniref:BUD13-like protein n=1 Tax=Quillaja saponaria TaxID=32244 RepID=A0AAD7KS00_QUISA|nr:BUD13-like protein [Quillaja saponaria]
MAGSTLGSSSLKDYLKRYESTNVEDKKKKKKKKTTKPQASGVLVVDEDPVWQKPVDLAEENADGSSDEEKPQVDEDIEVKRMKRLEQLRARRPYNAISEDGSGWISLSPKHLNSINSNSDMSPPRKQRVRNDTPSPEPEPKHSNYNRGADLSPPRQRFKRYDSPSPQRDTKLTHPTAMRTDISPSRKRNVRKPLQDSGLKPSNSGIEGTDQSPPRHRRKHYHTPSPEHDNNPALSPRMHTDISPPRRPRRQALTDHERKNYETHDFPDISPPRRGRHDSPYRANMHVSSRSDLSPTRKSSKDAVRPALHRPSAEAGDSHSSLPSDLSPPRRKQKELSGTVPTNDQRKTGLISGKDIREEIDKTKKDEWSRFKQMDPSISGRGAEPVYRDKKKGERISKDEFLKSQKKVEEKPKEKKLEWGKGLAQKREAEARLQELELEKDKPFAQTRDNPELDKILKERVRWGDPMAHLVKKKYPEPVLPNFGDNEKMKESGFVIPQEIPDHSWLKRGLDAAPNRYGIRPGRHWDGVDRSTGFEKESFKRTNEKQAREKEAYLWSVSDM